jgi:hypothetical protein
LSRITGSTPRSMVSTTSAWCSASRAAQLMASDGVASATGSRWRGRSPPGCVRLGQQRSTSRATGPVKAMKVSASTMLKPRWNSTTCWCTSVHVLLQQHVGSTQQRDGQQRAHGLEDEVAQRQPAQFGLAATR